MDHDELEQLVKRLYAWAEALEVIGGESKGMAPAIRRQARKIEAALAGANESAA